MQPLDTSDAPGWKWHLLRAVIVGAFVSGAGSIVTQMVFWPGPSTFQEAAIVDVVGPLAIIAASADFCFGWLLRRRHPS